MIRDMQRRAVQLQWSHECASVTSPEFCTMWLVGIRFCGKKRSRSLHHLPSRVMNSSNVQIVNHPKEIATVHDRKMYLNLAEPWKEKLSVKKEMIRQAV